MNVYQHQSYKKFLVDLIENDFTSSRGKRKMMAEAGNCQVSHVTHVLSGEGHFSPEQLEGIARFFGLGNDEIEFLLLLLGLARAGTTSLKNFYSQLIENKLKSRSELKGRLKIPDSMAKADEAIYYSSWLYGAVHVMLSIPDLQTKEALSQALSLSLARSEEILSFLIKTGLCKKEGNRYKLLRPLLHLEKSSPLISKHHANWRMKALQSLENMDEEKLHYSSVFTLSKNDFTKVREILMESLAQSLKVIKDSPEEVPAVICLDYFKLF